MTIEKLLKITNIGAAIAGIAGTLLDSKCDALKEELLKETLKKEILEEIAKNANK